MSTKPETVVARAAIVVVPPVMTMVVRVAVLVVVAVSTVVVIGVVA